MRSPRCVLVADDEPAIRALVKRTLIRAGFDAIEAADGAEAIERIDRCNFDALVLDLMMPRVDGFGVIDHVIETNPHMVEKTVVMTAFPRAAAQQRLQHLCHIMAKPFELHELIAAVKECASR